MVFNVVLFKVHLLFLYNFKKERFQIVSPIKLVLLFSLLPSISLEKIPLSSLFICWPLYSPSCFTRNGDHHGTQLP